MATYYVKNGGSDALSGLDDDNAWETIAKVSGYTFTAGDTILFNRGDMWRETLVVHDDGTENNLITYDAYGTGADPIFDGADIIADVAWADQGGNVWKAAATTEPKQLFVDGVRINKSRWPATGYETINTTSGDKLHLQSNALDQADDYWIGCVACVKTCLWRMEQVTITDSAQVAETITWVGNTAETPTDGYGFYIEGHVDNVTTDMSWAWLADEVYLYLDNDDPTAYVITGSVRENGIYAYEKDYITIQNLAVRNTNDEGIFARGGNYVTIDNCTASYTYGYGIIIYDYPQDYDHGFSTVSNNTISYSQADGIMSTGMTDITFSSNDISYAGVGTTSPRDCRGITLKNDNNIVSNNTVNQVGGHGIYIGPRPGNLVTQNTVTNWCVNQGDSGAIYVSFYAVAVDTTITHNLIHTCTGTVEGTNKAEGYENPVGIYLDASGDVVCTHNIIYDMLKGHGFGLSAYNTNMIYNNTVYNCKVGIVFADYLTGAGGGRLVKNNIFMCGSADQNAYRMLSPSGIGTELGLFSNNCLYDALDEDLVLDDNGGAPAEMTLAGWQVAYTQDANSVQADPLFVDAASNDFHLAAGSPCIRAGEDVGLAEDFDGVVLFGIPEIGAYYRVRKFGLVKM